MNFVHLHLHTEYSLLDGVLKIKPLVDKVKEMGMNAVALTDHGVMYGVYEFWQTCKEAGIKPIIGCEVYVAKRSRFDRDPNFDSERFHLTLLAKNEEGYHNLLKMVSLAHTEGFYYKPRTDKELLKKYGKGIIALSGCLGSNFNSLLLNKKKDEAVKWLQFLKTCFSGVYVELQRNGIKESLDLINIQKEVAAKMDLPVIATCDVHYLDEEDYKIQEIAWCIGDGKKISDPTRRRYGSTEFYLKSPKQMAELFKDIPEALSNTQKLADSVEEYSIEFERIQPKFDTALNAAETRALLKQHVYDRVTTRYLELTPEIKTRIDYELQIINDKGYNDYFLVVEDYVTWARNNGMLVGCRGSAAGSLVAYILGISNLDPFKWKLIFERFLNPERPSPPDFDIDFQDDRRDELFTYMSNKYGRNHTSYVGTFGRLKTKAAIRDVARVMGVDLAIADKLSKMVIVKFGKVHSIAKMREEVKEFDEMIEDSAQLEELVKYVAKLENIARHVSIHACGYLVTPNDITDYVPVQIETKGGEKVITQIEGQHLEPMGLMKFDFLGLRNLTIIAKTLKQIKYTSDKIFDIEKIPLDDKETFDTFQKGKTVGIFQFESDGMQKYLRDLKPTEIEDLIFLNAAYRPGPMKYIYDYIKRKRGEEKVTYLDPSLEPILKPTYGFAIYQEQVISIAVEYAKYRLGEADMLRRAMGKKKHEVMEKEKVKFMEKSLAAGHTKKNAEEVFAYLEPFADYGFNRSHSAVYSILAYQTGYLKTHYPVEFMASLLENDADDPDKLKKVLKEVKEMKLEILPPNINKSYVSFSIEDQQKIRYGFHGVKGLGEKSMREVVQERLKNGDYQSLDDLINRNGTQRLTKKDVECLIKVGALDEFGSRKQLLAIAPLVFEKVIRNLKQVAGGQADLFVLEPDMQSNERTSLPNVAKESEVEKLLWEKELLGTFISTHPLTKYQDLYATDKLISLTKAKGLSDKSRFTTLALISRCKVIYTKKGGQPMAFIELEDLEDKCDAVVFPKTYQEIQEQLSENIPVIIKASVTYRNDEYGIIIDEVIAAEAMDLAKEAVINITSEKDKDSLVTLKKLIKDNPGKFKLKIIYGSPYQPKEIVKKIMPTTEVISFINKYRKQ